jgi:hypothetical protein
MPDLHAVFKKAQRGGRRDGRSAHLRREVRLMAIKRLAVIVLLALLAVTVALLLVPGLSWAAVYEWLMTTGTPGSSPCGCVFGRG